MNVKRITSLIVFAILCMNAWSQFRTTNRDYHPKWSPDGTSLIYYAYGINRQGIYIRNIKTNQERKVGNIFGSHPRFSPDGKSIVYCTRDKGTLVISDLKGNVIKEIKTGLEGLLFHPVWSPNGKQIVFDMSLKRKSSLYIINIDGTELKTIVKEGNRASQANFFDNGKQIIFGANFNGEKNKDIYTMTLDDLKIKQITNTSNINEWAPDVSNTKEIVFVANDLGSNSIYKTNLEGNFRKHLTSKLTNSYIPDWSPNGKKVAFSSETFGMSEVIIIDKNGRNYKNITRNSITNESPSVVGNHVLFVSKREGKPQVYTYNLSEKKSKLVFSSNKNLNIPVANSLKQIFYEVKTPDGSNIYRWNAKTKKEKAIVNSENNESNPTLSPNGKLLCYEVELNSKRDLIVLDLSTNKTINVTNTKEVSEENPSWIDNQTLVYNSDKTGDYELYQLDITTGKNSQITNTKSHEFMGEVSPNKSKITFVSNKDENYEIYVMHLKTRKIQRLTNNKNHDFLPRWIDNKTIVYQSNKNGNTEVYKINVDTKKTTQLTSLDN
ncbi:PD40 domain-containing protein [Aquimarina spinulae]|uniref:PD40 domain-containing protein n=1 Tax=Aquimarina spinulae TaxID=1192023 RepID=UPI00131F1CA5|nr:PD40 domain-containing protein [Aquimarina spinulae]